VIGLDPAATTSTELASLAAPSQVTATLHAAAPTSAPAPTASGLVTIVTGACPAYLGDACRGGSLPSAEAVSSCASGGDDAPTGDLAVVVASGGIPEGTIRIRIEVEQGLAIDGECFAGEVLDILNDARSWGVPFAQVDDESYDLRLVLASPTTTDSLCSPLQTGGIYSCRNGGNVVINLMRWTSGTDEYAKDLTTYRRYLINHEVGHFLGRGHLPCPGVGNPAPVMMQQTKGLGQCTPNGWPTESEHATRN
jgi:hypothetical protein